MPEEIQQSTDTGSAAIADPPTAKFQQDVQNSISTFDASSSAQTPSLPDSVVDQNSITFAASSGANIQLAGDPYRCRYYDDAGNTGWGMCYDNGTIRIDS